MRMLYLILYIVYRTVLLRRTLFGYNYIRTIRKFRTSSRYIRPWTVLYRAGRVVPATARQTTRTMQYLSVIIIRLNYSRVLDIFSIFFCVNICKFVEPLLFIVCESV